MERSPSSERQDRSRLNLLVVMLSNPEDDIDGGKRVSVLESLEEAVQELPLKTAPVD